MTHDTIAQDDAPEDNESQGTGPQPSTPSMFTQPATSILVDLDHITEMSTYTRTLREDHIKELTDSIATIDLEVPLVLITGNQLVAGRHRLHALRRLKDTKPERYDELFPSGVPAMLYDIGENPDTNAVLALELTENAMRRNLSPEERLRVLDNLRKQGHQLKRGRHKPDGSHLIPKLMEMLGVSKATVSRLLATTRAAGSASADTIPKPKGRSKKAAATVEVETEADVDTETLAPTDALEPTLKLDPVQVACDAVRRLNRKELELFSSWFAEHVDAIKVLAQDDDT